MITEEQLIKNKNEFVELLKSITRPNSDIESLINYLEEINFFNAPSSTQYQCSYKGGLCEHSLNVYKTLKELVNTYSNKEIPEDSLKIVGLLSEINKSHLFEEYIKNEKIYSPEGKKYDEMGKFDWIASKSYKYKDAKNRFVLGTRDFNTYYIVSSFIPLTMDETISLVNNHSITNKTETTDDICSLMNNCNLLVYLHSANLISCYCIEKE